MRQQSDCRHLLESCNAGRMAVAGMSFRPISGQAMNQEIRLFGAIAVRPAILAALSQFETATGLSVAAKFALNPAVKKQIGAGEPFDVVITNTNLVDDLVGLGKVAAGSQAALGRIAMGVAAKAGSQPIDIGSADAFASTLKDAKSIAYTSEGTSGSYFSGLLERLGIADQIRPKLVPISGGETASAVGRGDAELGVVPVTSILAAAPEVVLVGKFPAELQSYIDFAIGISADATDFEAAKRLLEFLMAPATDGVLAAKGVER